MFSGTSEMEHWLEMSKIKNYSIVIIHVDLIMWFSFCVHSGTNTPRVFHVETACKRLFPVVSTWNTRGVFSNYHVESGLLFLGVVSSRVIRSIFRTHTAQKIKFCITDFLIFCALPVKHLRWSFFAFCR